MKQMVTVQDISCLGKCSMTVVLPVLSAMGVECAALPTALLSTHTAFPGPAVLDLEDMARRTLDHWAGLGVQFRGILTGYLANERHALLADRLFRELSEPGAIWVVDPAMADHGRLYGGLGENMIGVQRDLCRQADLALPNLTEAAMMAGMEYREGCDLGYLRELAAGLGFGSVMITGAEPERGKTGFYWTDGKDEFLHTGKKLPRSCHGTGDLFAAVTMGGLMQGKGATDSGILAAEFVRRAIAATGEDSRYGVAFEGELGWLAGQV